MELETIGVTGEKRRLIESHGMKPHASRITQWCTLIWKITLEHSMYDVRTFLPISHV